MLSKFGLKILNIIIVLCLMYSSAQANDIDADKTIGIAPLDVQFQLNVDTWSYSQEWSFGDGEVSKERNPVHVYTKPGQYKVSVTYRNRDGRFEITREKFVTVYSPCGLAKLNIVQTTSTWPGEDWTNAIDGDAYNYNGTVSALGAPASVVLEFSDAQIKKVEKLRLLADSGINNTRYQVTQATVAFSETGTLDDDFTSVGTITITEADWGEILLPKISAKYIKLTLNAPTTNLKQFSEFEVFTEYKQIDSLQSTISATGPQVANGVEQSEIKLYLNDMDGAPVSGKTLGDINIYVSGKNNYLTDFHESGPGVYVIYLASLTAEEKIITAYVNGVPVAYTDINYKNRTKTNFSQAETQPGRFNIVDSSETWPNEGWSKAFDGIEEGSNAFVSTCGQPAFVTVEFIEQNIQWINKLRIKTKANTIRENRSHWVKEFCLLVSTTGLDDADFVNVLQEPVLNGDWQEYAFPAVAARYIKINLEKPISSKWKQICEIQINTVMAPTPVELAAFDVALKDNVVELTWVTVSESKNYGFEVQRKTEFSEYQKIGFIAGHGTTQATHRYSYLDENISNNVYYYRLKQIDVDGAFALSSEKIVRRDVSKRFQLIQNFPNPFNPETVIQYHVGEAGIVTISIKNILGQEIKQLVHEFHQTGSHEVAWNGTDRNEIQVPSGTYLYSIESKDYRESRRMILLR